MLNETKRMGLPPPQFQEMSEFVVTFRNAPLSLGSRSRSASLLERESGTRQLTLDVFPEGAGASSSSSSRILDRNVRIESAMRYIHEHGSILNREYRALTGVSEQTAMRDLEMLVEQGTLRRIGKTRARRYILPQSDYNLFLQPLHRACSLGMNALIEAIASSEKLADLHELR